MIEAADQSDNTVAKPTEKSTTPPLLAAAVDASQDKQLIRARRNIRSRALIYFEIISCLCAVFALLGLLVQIRADADARRVSATLDYVNQFNSDPISNHRLNIERAWLPMREQLSQVNRIGGLSAPAIDKTVAVVMADYDAKNPQSPATLSVIELASFYDRAILCVKAQICDEAIFDMYFRQQISSFWGMYDTLILDSRSFSSPLLGSITEDYLGDQAR